ncbi:MAG TPA: glycosyltransferase family 2 protein [Flavobacteriaceae bacterium]|nr:glycosyltransferase family 2 protein [Flavobacteriaceae bacterium]
MQSTEEKFINKLKQQQVADEGQNANRKKSKNPITTKSLVLIGSFLLLCGALFALLYFNPYFEQIHLERLNNFGGRPLLLFGLSLLAINVLMLLFMLSLYLRYRSIPPVTDEQLLKTTVIVPAYNEGELVYKTLKSLVKSDFPKDKLQLIAIDDGSQDDTWIWMLKAKAELGDKVAIYQQPENRGKRHALHRGFKLATGEIFITVDSDSIVDKDTLRNMVSPFIKDQSCGAVAGNVRVLNRKKGLIPQMLEVSFAFSFEFIRSAQSTLGSVFCTPGALSAYRKEAVMNCLPEWINQTFMGQASTIGEDRAMTNMILKQGYKVFFQRNAYVFTNTPLEYRNLHKMFTRWERSNVRETIAMSKFAFTNFREGAKTPTRLLLLYYWSRLLLAIPLLLLLTISVVMYPLLILNGTLVGILVFSSIQALFYARYRNIKESFWAYPYSIFYAFTLFWITPYAILTAGRGGWLTRELPKVD